MTGFVAVSPVIGTQPMDIFFDPDTVQRQPLGMVVSAWHKYWGQGELVYYKASENLILGSLVNVQLGGTVRLQPNTANTGYSCLIAISAMSANEFGWFMKSGTYIVRGGASIAVDTAIGITGPGGIGAISAGKQRTSSPFTTTQPTLASTVLKVWLQW